VTTVLTHRPRLNAPATRGRHRKIARLVLGSVGLVVFVAINYAWAWQDAHRLSADRMAEAEASYARGRYLEALTGYEERDPLTGERLAKGGYIQVVHLWDSPYAWPRPALVQNAGERIHDIVRNDLTRADAERFVEATRGRASAYLPDIYLRLGELYEAEGDPASALSVYRDVLEFFPARPDIVATARQHLTHLESQP
jgi:hypothetical protein